MPRTGQVAEVSGVYRNDCAAPGHHREIALSQGETFPPCRDCHRAVNWTLVRRTL